MVSYFVPQSEAVRVNVWGSILTTERRPRPGPF